MKNGLALLVSVSFFACAAAERAEESAMTEAPIEDATVRSIANIGDSISQGFDADDAKPLDLNIASSTPDKVFMDMPELSWVQGTDARVKSVRAHYAKSWATLTMTPMSKSGAEYVGKDSKVPNFEAQAKAITTKPDLVYVLLGGNDVCNRDKIENMYSVDELRAAIAKGLTALEDALEPGAAVNFVSMPRVDTLYDLGTTQIPIISSLFGATNTTCSAFWQLAASSARGGVCKIVTLEASAEKRAEIGKRVDEYNAAIAAEVRAFSKDASKNPKRIAFRSDWQGSIAEGAAKNASGGTFVFEAKHLSKTDCFHPSIAGQNALAEMVIERAKFE